MLRKAFVPAQIILDHEISCLCAQDANFGNIRFITGTNKLDGSNSVYSVQVNEERVCSVSKLPLPEGSISHISCSYEDSNIVVITFSKVHENFVNSHGVLWKIQPDFSDAEKINLNSDCIIWYV
ncbi:hypothetical protein GJ496_004788 [Pomphorhynchus laevis]|nr:hypothetical protein GJ496_004788 [Pomphorhynchus laevis]